MVFLALTVATVTLGLFGGSQAAIAADEITTLPGWDGALPSKQYSGYLKVTTARYSYCWNIQSPSPTLSVH